MRELPQKFVRSRQNSPACVIVVLGASIAAAQSQSGQRPDGYRRRPKRAVVTGATVTARNLAPASPVQPLPVTMRLPLFAPAGRYEVTSEAPTFKKVVISRVPVTVGKAPSSALIWRSVGRTLLSTFRAMC